MKNNICYSIGWAGRDHDINFFHEANDCSVTTLSNATGLSYHESHYIFKNEGRLDGDGVTFKVCDKVYSKFGKYYDSNPNNTLNWFIKNNQTGIFILNMCNHVTCIKDGIVFDTWKVGGKSAY